MDRWPPNKALGAVNTRTALIPFSRKLDTWSFINETRGKITRHTVWISSLSQFAMFEKIYQKWRYVKGKTFSWSCRRSHQSISTTEVGFYHLALIFSDIFEIYLIYGFSHIILIPWSRVSTWAGDQVCRKMTSNYMTVSDWRFYCCDTPRHTADLKSGR